MQSLKALYTREADAPSVRNGEQMLEARIRPLFGHETGSPNNRNNVGNYRSFIRFANFKFH